MPPTLTTPRPVSGVCRRPRFTLVELLVVVAIIAVLASLLMPALGKARQMAYRTLCGSNQKQVAIGMLSYAGDNEVLPQRTGFAATWPHTLGNDPTNMCYGDISEQMLEYVGDKRVFYCPTDWNERTAETRWPDPSSGAVVTNYQYPSLTDPSVWLIARPDPVAWDPDVVLLADWLYSDASRPLNITLPLFYNHAYGGNGPIGMNQTAGDGSVTWYSGSLGYVAWSRPMRSQDCVVVLQRAWYSRGTPTP